MTRRLLAKALTVGIALRGGLTAQTRVEARTITLTQYGFEPKELTVKPGRLSLNVRSRLPGKLAVQLIETGRQAPAKLLQSPHRMVVREEVVLTQGEYSLIDPRFPQWKCTVKVQP